MSGGGNRLSSCLTFSKSCKKFKTCYNSDVCNHIIGDYMKSGFTLAEVLITLGIIGIVAALTMPALIVHHRKSVAETRLKKFYTNINQAIILSEAENGDRKSWAYDSASEEAFEKTYNTYFDKYLITLDKKFEIYNGRVGASLKYSDGSGVRISGRDFNFCTKAEYLNNINYWETKAQCFLFGFYPSFQTSYSQKCVIENYFNKGVEPYLNENFNCNKLEDNRILCNEFQYSKVLQRNGWHFPKDCKVKL